MRNGTCSRGGRWKSIGYVVFLGLVLFAPRIARLLHPRIWAEDEQFAMAAELVRQGAKPYHDFVHVNPPVLEWGLAGWFQAFGTSLGSCEVLTALAVAGTSFGLFLLLCTEGRVAALLAALFYGTSSLVFRYHVFEREVFTNALVLAAWWLARRNDWTASRRRLVGIVVCFTLAASCKLTALLPALAFFTWATVRGVSRARVILVASSTLGAVALALLVLGWRYGEAFWLQLFVFPLVKGTNVPDLAARADVLIAQLEPVFILAVPAFALLVCTRVSALVQLAGISLAFEVAFKWFLKPTLWAHNLIPALLPASLLAAVCLGQLVTRRGPFAARWRTTVVVLSVLLLSVPWWQRALRKTPGEREPARGDERVLLHGFGGLPRSSWMALRDAARTRLTRGESILVTSDWIPLAVGARPLLTFWETEPAWQELRAAHVEGRLWAFVRAQRGKTFEQRQAETYPIAARHVFEAWRSGALRWVLSPDAVRLGRTLGLPVTDVDVPGAFLLERLPEP